VRTIVCGAESPVEKLINRWKWAWAGASVVFALIVCLISFLFLKNEFNQKEQEGRSHLKWVTQTTSRMLTHSIADLDYLTTVLKDRLSPGVFLAFMKAHPEYTQLRLLKEDGREAYRINRQGRTIEEVPLGELQDKSSRYYFKKLKNLGKEEIYISDLNINQEEGEHYQSPNWRYQTARLGKRVHLGRENQFFVLNLNPYALEDELSVYFKKLNALQVNQNFLVGDGKSSDDFSSFSFSDSISLKNLEGGQGIVSDTDVWKITIFSNNPILKHYLWALLLVSLGCIVSFSLFSFWLLRSFYRGYQFENYKKAFNENAMLSVTDEDGVILHVNSKFCEISGYTEAELIGKTHQVLKSNKHTKIFFKELWGTIKAGRVWRGNILNKRKNGLEYWLDTTIVPLCDEKGHPKRFCAIRFEATREIQLEQELRKKRQFLYQTTQLANIGQMSASIAHEFHTPLAIISSSIDILQEELSHEYQNNPILKEQIGILESTVRDSFVLTQLLTQLARGSAGGLPKEDVLLSEVLDSAVRLCSHKLSSCGVHLKLSDELASYRVIGNRILLIQVFVNLFNNSVDAIKSHDERWIRVEAEDPTQHEVRLRIVDSGKGIPYEVQLKIFDPFYSSKDFSDGTGLGLSLAKQIVEDYGGELSYDTYEGQTSFLLKMLSAS